MTYEHHHARFTQGSPKVNRKFLKYLRSISVKNQLKLLETCVQPGYRMEGYLLVVG